jgi:hypothetical protein
MTDILAVIDVAIEQLRATRRSAAAESWRDDAAQIPDSRRGEKSDANSKQTRSPQKPSTVGAIGAGTAFISDPTSHSQNEDVTIEKSEDSRVISNFSPIKEITPSTPTFEDFRHFASWRNVSHTAPTAPRSEHFRHSSRPLDANRRAYGDINGLAGLDPSHPFGDTPPSRWAQLLADAEALIAGGWAAQARALGWTALDLFGCDPDRPFARIDQQGLCWQLNGRKVIALTATAATIETLSGARLTYRRSPGRKGQMLPWHRRGGGPRQCS